MRTLTVIALAALLLFLGYRAVNHTFSQSVSPAVNQTTNQLIEVIIEEVEE